VNIKKKIRSGLIYSVLLMLFLFCYQYFSLYPVLLTSQEFAIKSDLKNNILINYLNVDDKKVKTIYIEGKADLPVVIYFHGNNELIDHNAYYLKDILGREGIGILMVEYNGYGSSDGFPSLEGTNNALLKALDYYKLNDKEKIVWGRSIGSAHAFDFTFKYPEKVDKLMILSGFVSPLNIFVLDEDYVHYLDYLMFFDYNVKKKIKKYKNPNKIEVFLMHGEDDALFGVGATHQLEDILSKNNFKTKKLIFAGTHNIVNIENKEYIKFILGDKRYEEKQRKEVKFLKSLNIIKGMESHLKTPNL
jgi:predicted esterase